MTNFIKKEGQIRAIKDINVRIGAPSLTAKIISMPKGTIFSVIGCVTNGDEFNSNAIWYKTSESNYIWSGNAEFINKETLSNKILHAPLPYLICTQRFGERPELYKNYGSPKGHNGLDFRTWVDNNPNNWEQLVFSVLDGVVSESANDAKFKGKYVRVKHNNGYESVYLHLSKQIVESGQQINAGEKIGISGNSGEVSEAPHLHFGYRPIKCDINNGYMGYINPTELFIDEVKFA